jgi:hypothetical protein
VRNRTAVAVATVAHAAILVGLCFVESRPRPAPARATEDVDAVEIELNPPGEPIAPDVHSPSLATARAGAVAHAATAERRDAPSSRADEDAWPRAAEPAPTGSVTLFVPNLDAIGLGPPGAPNRFVTAEHDADPTSASPAPPTAAEAKRAVEDSLAAAKNARDTDVGLGPEGPVLSALEGATYGSTAPERGGASFLVVVDASGSVTGLRLQSSRGGESGWLDVRDRAARALAGKRLALRGGKGAELTIAVESDVGLPSGAAPSKPVIPTLEHSRIARSEHAPEGGTADVVKSYTVARFDLADVKARPVQIVHARLVAISSF